MMKAPHTMLPHNSYPHIMMTMSLSFLITTLLLSKTEGSLIMEWTFLSLNSVQMTMPIMLDSMSTMFMSTVTFISYNVLTFSKTYMKEEPNLTRFTHLVSLFILSMLLLIMSPNVISMMLGWDGLGLTSFLLVIYYQNQPSLKSGMITALTNRIGDAFLLIAMGLIISQGHWNMMNMWSNTLNAPSLVSILITLAAMTKSAQIPFTAWLPEAMAAPTPVSALVHSSTLVTAGVFILIRLYPFLSETKMFNSMLLASGLITSLMGAYWSSAHPDQKKAVALSTMSQLGLMMVSLGLNMVTFCFIHLLTHAMFKATLFMGVGVAIIMKHHRQFKDNLRMRTYMPHVSVAVGLSLISMNAFFFTAGYYSKEIILETSIYQPWTLPMFCILGMATMFTTIYSVPLWRINVQSPITQSQYPYENLSHSPKIWYINSNNKTLNTPMIMMSLGTITMGSIAFWLFIPPAEIPMLPTYKHFAAFMWTGLGLLSAVYFCRLTTKYKNPYTVLMENIRSSSSKALKIEELYNKSPYSYNTMPMNMKIFAWNTLSIKLKWVMLLKKLENITFLSTTKFKLFGKTLKFPTGLPPKLYSFKMYNITLKIPFFSFTKYNLNFTKEQKAKKWNSLLPNDHRNVNKDNIRKEVTDLWFTSTISFNLAKPVLNISLSTLKTLDQGMTILMTAQGLKTMFPKLSSLILSHQSNHSTKALLLFILLIFMMLPLFI